MKGFFCCFIRQSSGSILGWDTLLIKSSEEGHGSLENREKVLGMKGLSRGWLIASPGFTILCVVLSVPAYCSYWRERLR
jgi:hypothetical protein